MLSFWVDVFDYTSNETFSVYLAGYLYAGTGDGPYWVNPTAIVHASRGAATTRNFTIRFTQSTAQDRHIIYIGELTSAWSYPHVRVRDVAGGFSGDVEDLRDGWDVALEASAFEQAEKLVATGTYHNILSLTDRHVLGYIEDSAQLAADTVGSSAIDLTDNYDWSGDHTFDSGLNLGGAIVHDLSSGNLMQTSGGRALIVQNNSDGALSIGGDDALILGSGEARGTIVSNSDTGLEYLHLGSDAHTYIYSGIQAGWGSHYTWTFKNDGETTMPGDLIPNASGSHDLGLTGTRWRTLYLSAELDAGTDITAGGTIAGAAVTSGGNAVLTTASTIDASVIDLTDAYTWTGAHEFDSTVRFDDDLDINADIDLAGSITIAGTGTGRVFAWEGGNHYIYANDGAGNVGWRMAHNFNGSNEVFTEDGHACHITFTQASGAPSNSRSVRTASSMT